MTDTAQAPTPFVVVDRSALEETEDGQAYLAELDAAGVQIVTRAEMRFLKEWSWGPDAHVETCEKCDERMVFERHPADWPWHPGDPNQPAPDGSPMHVRCVIECPKCGHVQHTDGITETEYKAKFDAASRAKALAEWAKRTGEDPSLVVDVFAEERARAAQVGVAQEGTPPSGAAAETSGLSEATPPAE